MTYRKACNAGPVRGQPHPSSARKALSTGDAPARRAGRPRPRPPAQRRFELRRRALALVSSALCICLSGCGYSLSGRGAFLPAHIKIIGVPMFVNSTPVFEVEQKITAKVQAELIGRGRYEIRPGREAVDAVLLGEIQGIAVAPAAFNDQQQATRYAVTLVAKIEFRDLKTDKVLWANPQMVFSEQYDVTTTQTATDPNAFLGQNVNAMERLASEFARTVVSAILESF